VSGDGHHAQYMHTGAISRPSRSAQPHHAPEPAPDRESAPIARSGRRRTTAGGHDRWSRAIRDEAQVRPDHETSPRARNPSVAVRCSAPLRMRDLKEEARRLPQCSWTIAGQGHKLHTRDGACRIRRQAHPLHRRCSPTGAPCQPRATRAANSEPAAESRRHGPHRSAR
jgi:hypothetical protein